MKKFATRLALVAILSFALTPPQASAATAIYNATVSATTSASTVTPTAANGKPTSVIVQNDGAGDIFVDFDRTAVANSATVVRVKACAMLKLNVDSNSFSYLSVITASGTATARVTAHYLRGTVPQSPSTNDRLVFAANPNCTTLVSLPAYGASVASATALPAPTGQVFHVTGTTSITSITTTGLVAGARITLIFDGTIGGSGVVDGNNLKMAGNFAADASDTLSFVFDGTDLFETSRSAN